MSKVNIATVQTKEQLEAILPLIDAYQEFYGAVSNRERNRAFFGKLLGSDMCMQLVASLDGNAVGFATLYKHLSSITVQEFILMNDLYVLPQTRGIGVGRALIEACREHSREMGFDSIEWQTQLENQQAQKLYDQLNDHKSYWITYGLGAPV